MTPFPNGIYIGTYKNVRYHSKGGEIQCLFGWVPKTFHSIRRFKLAVTRREKEE